MYSVHPVLGVGDGVIVTLGVTVGVIEVLGVLVGVIVGVKEGVTDGVRDGDGVNVGVIDGVGVNVEVDLVTTGVGIISAGFGVVVVEVTLTTKGVVVATGVKYFGAVNGVVITFFGLSFGCSSNGSSIIFSLPFFLQKK